MCWRMPCTKVLAVLFNKVCGTQLLCNKGMRHGRGLQPMTARRRRIRRLSGLELFPTPEPAWEGVLAGLVPCQIASAAVARGNHHRCVLRRPHQYESPWDAGERGDAIRRSGLHQSDREPLP